MSICAEATVAERLPVDRATATASSGSVTPTSSSRRAPVPARPARSSIGWRRSYSTMPSPRTDRWDHLHRESRCRASRPRPAAVRGDRPRRRCRRRPQRRDRAASAAPARQRGHRHPPFLRAASAGRASRRGRSATRRRRPRRDQQPGRFRTALAGVPRCPARRRHDGPHAAVPRGVRCSTR